MCPSNTRPSWQQECGVLTIALIAGLLTRARPVRAQDCTELLPLLQQGRNAVEISRITGLSANTVEDCRVQLSRPSQESPAGPPPIGAAGRPPHGAAGRAPIGAAGPPPHSAAGPPPIGAAGPPPISRQGPRLQ